MNALGGFGVWVYGSRHSQQELREAAALVESLGFEAFWLGGSPEVADLRPLLAATAKIVIGTSIVNIWTTDPAMAAAEWAGLEREFPGRAIVGVGAGHREVQGNYQKPLSAVCEFLDRIDCAPTPIPPERRVLAALGPRMLDLSAQRSAGTIPYFVSLAHTRFARRRIGPEVLLAPEMACVLDPDPVAARARARDYSAVYLGLSNYVAPLLDHGFDESDVLDGGSDRLIDAIVPHGEASEVAAAAREHVAMGADHVVLQPIVGASGGIPRDEWSALAVALSLLTG